MIQGRPPTMLRTHRAMIEGTSINSLITGWIRTQVTIHCITLIQIPVLYIEEKCIEPQMWFLRGEG